MVGGSGEGDYKKVYGNDNTVYLNASVKTIKVDTPNDRWHGIIDDVDSVTTGIDNVSLDVFTEKDAKTTANTNGKITVGSNECSVVAYGAYALYDDDGYIIAAVTVADDGSTSDNWVYVTSGGVTRESYDGEADQWTWSREVALDGVETEITYKGDALKYLDTMKKYNWYEVKYKGDGNVKSVTLAVDALAHYDASAANTTSCAVDTTDWGSVKYEGNINTLEKAVQDGKDTILYEASKYQGTDGATDHNHTGYGAFIDEEGQPYLKAGKTFYVNTTTTTGFRIKDETKVVFIQTNKQKETIEYYEGPDKLEDVVEDLNKGTNGFYDYEISAILDGNVARVVVVRDLNKDNGSDINIGDNEGPQGPAGYDLNVLALLDHDGSGDSGGEVAFIATGADKLTGAVKREAIKAAYAEECNVAASKVEVEYEDKKDGTMVYNVYVDGMLDASYTEAGVIKTVAVPTPAEQWKYTSDDNSRDVNEWRPLIKSNFLSNNAKFTPTGDFKENRPVVEVTGMKWNTNFDVKVPGFFYDNGINDGKTIKEAYNIQSGGTLYGSNNNTSSTAKVDGFAILPVLRTGDAGHVTYYIVFRGVDGKLYNAASGAELNSAGFTCDTTILKLTSK